GSVHGRGVLEVRSQSLSWPTRVRAAACHLVYRRVGGVAAKVPGGARRRRSASRGSGRAPRRRFLDDLLPLAWLANDVLLPLCRPVPSATRRTPDRLVPAGGANLVHLRQHGRRSRYAQRARLDGASGARENPIPLRYDVNGSRAATTVLGKNVNVGRA